MLWSLVAMDDEDNGAFTILEVVGGTSTTVGSTVDGKSDNKKPGEPSYWQ